MSRRAFTLIELLVVIAIIAILAAILFPVFAQAKAAALKTQAISNMKQQGTASILYAGDYEDLLPMAFPKAGGDYPFYMYNLWIPVPQDVQRGDLPENVEMWSNVWINSTAPYRKSTDLVAAPGVSPEPAIFREEDFVKKPTNVGLTFNGLLNDYPLSAVASPSALPMYTQVLGRANLKGASLATPTLVCFDGDQPCRYQRIANPADCQNSNGGFSQFIFLNDQPETVSRTMWVYGHGQIWVASDTSARYRRMGANIKGLTDYRTDPFADYTADGRPGAQWRTAGGCHAPLFVPDSDFGAFDGVYPETISLGSPL